MKQSVTVDTQLLWSGRYGCNNGRYGCTIVMSYIEINKAVSQWMLTFNLCVSVTWPLTCAFHIPCTHTPEIIDMHRGMCDNIIVFAYGVCVFESHKFSMQWNSNPYISYFRQFTLQRQIIMVVNLVYGRTPIPWIIVESQIDHPLQHKHLQIALNRWSTRID